MIAYAGVDSSNVPRCSVNLWHRLLHLQGFWAKLMSIVEY